MLNGANATSPEKITNEEVQEIMKKIPENLRTEIGKAIEEGISNLSTEEVWKSELKNSKNLIKLFPAVRYGTQHSFMQSSHLTQRTMSAALFSDKSTDRVNKGSYSAILRRDGY